MATYSTSYLDFVVSREDMVRVEESFLPLIREKFKNCEIYVSRNRDGWLFTNYDLTSEEEAIEFYASYLDEFYEDLKRLGVKEIIYYITFSSEYSDCNMEFRGLNRLLKYISNFCVSTYQTQESEDEQPTKINGNKSNPDVNKTNIIDKYNSILRRNAVNTADFCPIKV